MTASQHEYTSTACLHGQCGSCRRTCKFCDASCACTLAGCTHRDGSSLPVPWVDQARGIARELLDAIGSDTARMPRDLVARIRNDPALFWLRGEEQPPGIREAGGHAGPV